MSFELFLLIKGKQWQCTADLRSKLEEKNKIKEEREIKTNP